MADDIKTPDPAEPGSLPQLGRLPAVDARDRRFAMAAPPTARTFRNWLSPGPIWDQGSTPQCVSYAANRWLVSHKLVNQPPLALAAFYRECQKVDEWPGEDYDGTSVRASFKVLKALGYVESYGWATEVEPIVRHILEIGPVVIGIDWTDAMFRPDAYGYVWPSGRVVGGHAVMLSCANTRRRNPDDTTGAVRITNSWGEDWGQKGRVWLSFDAFQKLLDGLSGWPGEAATAVEVKHG
jgi:C1A family cysteine protease